MKPAKLDVLKDGNVVTLRNPTIEDLDRSCRFFRGLPAEDRQYLRFDGTSREVVARLINESEAGRAVRIEAIVGDEIVAHGALEFSTDGWYRHIGELRVIVAAAYRGRNLGTIMISHLFVEAQRLEVEKVVAKMAAPQRAARKILERLGFELEATLPDHIKDAEGNLHPMLVMSCSLDEVAKALREFYKEDNWWDG